MISRLLLAAPLLCAFAAPVLAQTDKVSLANGTEVTGVKVVSYDMRYLRYGKGSGAPETVPADQVAKVELGNFKDVYARGLNDPDIMLTIAREQLTGKEPVMAQFGMLRAAELFADAGKPQEAVGALDELAKALPQAGVTLDAFRLKVDIYYSQGPKGQSSVQTLAKKFSTDATAQGWASAAVEAQYVEAMASKLPPKDLQTALRAIVASAGGNQSLADRANVDLAHSLRESKEFDEAMRIYNDVAERSKDVNARAGAQLGIGKITFEQAKADDKEAFKKALLLFLRVPLESKGAWPGLQADAYYHAVLAAEKWQGPEYTTIMGRCRHRVLNEFPRSEWAERIRNGR